MLDIFSNKPAAIMAIGAPAALESSIAVALQDHAALFSVSWVKTLAEARQLLHAAPQDLILTPAVLADGHSLDLIQELGEQAPVPVVLLAADPAEVPDGNANRLYWDTLLPSELKPELLPKTLTRMLREWRNLQQYKEAKNALGKTQQALERAQLLGSTVSWEWDTVADRLVSCSPGYAALYEMSVEEALEHFSDYGKDLASIHKNDRTTYLEAHAQATVHRDTVDVEYRILTRSGLIRHVHETSRTVIDENGRSVYEYGSLRDITETKNAEQALRDSEERYRHLYHENPSMFFTINALGKVLSANSYGANHLGYEVEELINKPLASLVYEADVALALNCIQKTLAEPDQVHAWELRLVRKDGTQCWVRETTRAVAEVEGGQRVLLVCEDITETHRLSEQLSYYASHDPLTKLLNRREFDIRLQRVLDSAKEENTEHALCFLDLDKFKLVNDNCGHNAGDELLRQLGNLLKHAVRKRDTLARLGGDEFGVLMEHCNLQQAKRVAENLRKIIEEYRFGWEDRIFNVGVSIGLVPISNIGLSAADVLKQADAACYAAKDGGRNRIHVYLEADSDLARRHGEMQMIEQINRAMADNRMELYGQKIVPVKAADNPGAHYEVLVRMTDEQGVQINPEAFLAAAERYDVSPRLDRYIIEQVFSHLSNNPQQLEALSLCAINLSGLSLSNTDFHDFLLGLFKNSIIPAQKICFEITETAAISNLIDAAEFIRSLREQGCRFALDDFGSGLSSFAYLKSLPVDYLKIDGFFVRDIATDPISYAMVKSIHEIGKLMGMDTIAEFVENDAIVAKLTEIGVDYAQGYGISRPQPIAELHDA